MIILNLKVQLLWKLIDKLNKSHLSALDMTKKGLCYISMVSTAPSLLRNAFNKERVIQFWTSEPYHIKLKKF